MNAENLSIFDQSTLIVVADSCEFSRVRLCHILSRLGASKENIIEVSNESNLRDVFFSKKWDFIFLEENLILESDFFQSSITNFLENHLEVISMIMSSKTEEESVFNFIKSGIDFYLLKPFSENELLETLSSIKKEKLDKSEFVKKIKDGKQAFKAGKNEEARAFFMEATALSSSPELAYYHLAQIDTQENEFAAAIEKLNKGIRYNEHHIMSLKLLMDALTKSQTYEEAHNIGMKLSHLCHLSSSELEEVIRLCIRTKSFKDILHLADLAHSFSRKNQQLFNLIGAGLVVAGENEYEKGEERFALKCFSQVLDLCDNHPKYIKRVFIFLIEKNKTSVADQFLDRFSPENPNYKIYSFIIFSGKCSDPDIIIDNGIEIYEETKDELIIPIIKRAFLKVGRSFEDEFVF